jgi:hypothetical protein
MSRWFFKTKDEIIAEQRARHEREIDKKIERECKYYAWLIPKVLANCGVDHWVPKRDRPSLLEEKIIGVESRQKVSILEARYNQYAIYLWIDSRELPYNSDLSDLHTDQILETLSDACGRQVVWRSQPGRGSWYVIWRDGAINAIPERFAYNEGIGLLPASAPPLSFIAGVGENNKFIRGDITRMPHYLVAGSTNTGKSVHLNQLLCTLITRNPPDRVQFLMIDLKGGSEFAFYEDLPHLWEPVITRPADVPDALERFRAEMDKRYEMFTSAGVKTIEGYNDKFHDDPLPFIILVFDEVALLLKNTDRQLAHLAEDILADILARARSAGMHCVICTQTPRSDVVTPYIKINCPTRICFSVPGNHDSIAVLDRGDAAGLQPAGRGIYMFGPDLTEIQSPYISDDQIRAMVRDAIERGGGLVRVRPDGVTLDDLLAEAVDNYSGKLHPKKLFATFRGRIGRDHIEQMIDDIVGREIVFRGRRYNVVKRGNGRHGGRFLEPLDHAGNDSAAFGDRPDLRLVLPRLTPKPERSILKPAPETKTLKVS